MSSIRWLFALPLLALMALGVTLFLHRQPLVDQDLVLSETQRQWAEDWPMSTQPQVSLEDERATLTLSEAEANILANHLVDRLGDGRARVWIEFGRVHLVISLSLPWETPRSFVNLEMILVEGSPLPSLDQVRLAGLPLPPGLVMRVAERLGLTRERLELVESIRMEPRQLTIVQTVRPADLERLGKALLPAAELELLITHEQRLSAYLAAQPAGYPIELADLLSSLLAGAAQGGDPIAANRAVILLLGAYVNDRWVEAGAVDAGGAGPIPRHPVQLQGREDLARHFIGTAALTAQGDGALAELAGQVTLLGETGQGGGPSLAELTAKHAGTRFAELATGSPAGARRVQELARQGLSDQELMPALETLPEQIAGTSSGVDVTDPRNPVDQEMLQIIDERIDALPPYQTP
jgi:hypothetical protein